MKRFLPLLLLTACGETPRIHGMVVDWNGQPVPGAQIRAAQKQVVVSH